MTDTNNYIHMFGFRFYHDEDPPGYYSSTTSTSRVDQSSKAYDSTPRSASFTAGAHTPRTMAPPLRTPRTASNYPASPRGLVVTPPSSRRSLHYSTPATPRYVNWYTPSAKIIAKILRSMVVWKKNLFQMLWFIIYLYHICTANLPSEFQTWSMWFEALRLDCDYANPTHNPKV